MLIPLKKNSNSSLSIESSLTSSSLGPWLGPGGELPPAAVYSLLSLSFWALVLTFDNLTAIWILSKSLSFSNNPLDAYLYTSCLSSFDTVLILSYTLSLEVDPTVLVFSKHPLNTF